MTQGSMYAGKVPRDGQLPLAWEGLCAGAATAVSAVVTNPIEVRAVSSSILWEDGASDVHAMVGAGCEDSIAAARRAGEARLPTPAVLGRVECILEHWPDRGRAWAASRDDSGGAVQFFDEQCSVGTVHDFEGAPVWASRCRVGRSSFFVVEHAFQSLGCWDGSWVPRWGDWQPVLLGTGGVSRGFLASAFTAGCAWWPQVKARLQVQSSHFVTKARHQRYRGTFHALQSIASTEGQACK